MPYKTIIIDDMAMRGIWLQNQILQYREDLPRPVPDDNEALVKVSLAGICGTDLQLLKGYYPFTGIPGHEFVGEVVAAPNTNNLVGKRVVGEINISCGECEPCRNKQPSHCIHRLVLGIKNHNGAFADYLTLPVSNLYLVPDNVPDESAVFAEPLAAALEILEQIKIMPHNKVLIIGAGRLGQLVAQVFQTTGCKLQIVTRHRKQKRLLEERNINTISENQLPSASIDFVIEATGSPAGFKTALKAVKPRGTIVLKSTYKDTVDVNLAKIVVDEVSVIGSRCGPFDKAIKMLEKNIIDPEPLIDARFNLAGAEKGFTYAQKPGNLKVLLST